MVGQNVKCPHCQAIICISHKRCILPTLDHKCPECEKDTASLRTGTGHYLVKPCPGPDCKVICSRADGCEEVTCTVCKTVRKGLSSFRNTPLTHSTYSFVEGMVLRMR